MSLAVLMPLCAVLCSAVVPLFVALRRYFRLKSAAHEAATLTFVSEPFQWTVRTDHLLSYAFSTAAAWVEGPIRAIHAPAIVVHSLVSLVLSGHGNFNWHPQSVPEDTWVVLAFPVYALPAWWFVGQGLDGLLDRRRIRVAEMLVSAVLAAAFVALAAMLRFGLAAAEREGPAWWYMHGFAYWGVLLSVPLFAWLRQRTRSAQIANP